METELLGKRTKARIEHKCLGCGGVIKVGEYYDYSDGMSATYRNEYGESERKYYQCHFHIDNCESMDISSDSEPKATSFDLDFLF